MGQRSRRGCRECKRSRIKCDEVQPFCGTCARRDRQCPGYAVQAIEPSHESIQSPQSQIRPAKSSASSRRGSCATHHEYPGHLGLEPFSFSIVPHHPFAAVTSEIPGLDSISEQDKLAISYYFHDHLRRVGLGHEFVEDGNRKVFTLLQRYPDLISDILFAIGHTHMSTTDHKSLVPALSRKSRAIAKLRNSHGSQGDIEPMLLLALGIGVLELIDTTPTSSPSSIPALLSCAAHLVATHSGTCMPLGRLAKYFLRAFARQDIIFGLTHRRRNIIPTSLWLDGSCFDEVDRFLGLTMTLMPLLEELCSLSEQMKEHVEQPKPHESSSNALEAPLPPPDNFTSSDMTLRSASSLPAYALELQIQAQSLQQRITNWRPVISTASGSFLERRKYLLQAEAFRASALLYLHRLFQCPGSSPNADMTAMHMAYDILLSCHGEDAQLGLLLWPLLVAGCEMKSESDRKLVLELIDGNHQARGTYTSLRANEFLVTCAWPKADSGIATWNWMDLIDQFSGDFAPL